MDKQGKLAICTLAMLRRLFTLLAVLTGLAFVAEPVAPARASQPSMVTAVEARVCEASAPQAAGPRAALRAGLAASPCPVAGGDPGFAPSVRLRVDRARE